MAKVFKAVKHDPCDDIKKFITLWKENEKWKYNIEERLNQQENKIKDMTTFQAETKTYVTEIKSQIDRLETRLFSFMDGLVKNLTSKDETERKAEQSERVSTQDKWISFAKWIIAGTIFIIVLYFFGKDGGSK